jgi:hypothetical protein
MPTAGVIQMFLALTKFVGSVYRNNDSMLNATMEGCYEALKDRGLVTNDTGESLLLTLLQIPLKVCDACICSRCFGACHALPFLTEHSLWCASRVPACLKFINHTVSMFAGRILFQKDVRVPYTGMPTD